MGDPENVASQSYCDPQDQRFKTQPKVPSKICFKTKRHFLICNMSFIHFLKILPDNFGKKFNNTRCSSLGAETCQEDYQQDSIKHLHSATHKGI